VDIEAAACVHNLQYSSVQFSTCCETCLLDPRSDVWCERCESLGQSSHDVWGLHADTSGCVEKGYLCL